MAVGDGWQLGGSGRWIAAVLVALLVSTVALAASGSVLWLLVFCSLLLIALLGLILALHMTRQDSAEQPRALRLLLDLQGDRELREAHQTIAESLVQLSERRDPIFRNVALQRLTATSEQCKQLGEGELEFTSTESWRVVYGELLRSPGLHLYRSVAHIETPNYWQDGPGQQSTKLNLELHDAGVVSNVLAGLPRLGRFCSLRQ